jgi:hypothetical protein
LFFSGVFVFAILFLPVCAVSGPEYQDPVNAECFEWTGAFSPYQMNMLGVEFDKEVVEFNCSFGLPSACLSVDGTIVTMKREGLEKYIKE